MTRPVDDDALVGVRDSVAAEPGWPRLITAARRSLERTGGSLDGAISLGSPTEAERLVIIGVTGAYRSSAANRLTVRIAELDRHLREVYGTSLAEVVAEQAPLRNRPAELGRETAARDAMLDVAGAGRYAGEPWYQEWLAGLRRDGTMTRMVRTGLSMVEIVRVLDALPAADEPMPVFADRVLHDTKALSDGAVRGILLRAIAVWRATPGPVGTEQERALWESVGVVPDDLASQVLVLNLAAKGGLLGSWLTEARREGVPMRLTLYQLRLAPVGLDCASVFVCENPAVLRAAAATLGPRSAPLVCAEGAPSVAAHTLLRGLPDHAVIHWRNDFDWAGVRLTASALRRHPRAVPWRMTSEEYRSAPPNGPALLGTPAATPWEPALAATMGERGRAVMEESILTTLLADLGA